MDSRAVTPNQRRVRKVSKLGSRKGSLGQGWQSTLCDVSESDDGSTIGAGPSVLYRQGECRRDIQ